MGSAKIIDPEESSYIELTPNQTDKTGAIYLNKKVDIRHGFVSKFSFVVKNPGADGFAFVIHDSEKGSQDIGLGGSELGFGGISRWLIFFIFSTFF